MYQVMKLQEELRRLRQEVKSGEQRQATIDRIFEIEMLLANIYCYD